MIEYKYMNAEFVQQVAALEKQCFSMPWSENSISSELNNPLSLWIIAVEGERLLGYVGSQSVLGEADMMNLAVSPEYRKNGIGQKLVEVLINELKDKEVTSITLEVRESNIAAINLYIRLGFQKVGQRRGYYSNPKEDALILRKEWQL